MLLEASETHCWVEIHPAVGYDLTIITNVVEAPFGGNVSIAAAYSLMTTRYRCFNTSWRTGQNWSVRITGGLHGGPTVPACGLLMSPVLLIWKEKRNEIEMGLSLALKRHIGKGFVLLFWMCLFCKHHNISVLISILAWCDSQRAV